MSSSAVGSGYRRKRSVSISFRTRSTPGAGGYGFSFVFSFTTLCCGCSPGTYGSTLRIFLKSSSLTAMVLPLSILSRKLRKFWKCIYNCFICYTIRHSDISRTSKRASRNDQNIVFLRGITKFFFICNR